MTIRLGCSSFYDNGITRMVTSTRAYALRANFITCAYFFRIFMSVYYASANTRKDFTCRLTGEMSIFRLDLSAATRIHAKKGVVETSFAIAVICLFKFSRYCIFHGDRAGKVRIAFKLKIGYLECKLLILLHFDVLIRSVYSIWSCK